MEQQGVYDLEEIQKEARRLRSSKKKMPFHASLVSPSVELGVSIEYSEMNTYRGCRALKDLNEGDLITVSKAFAHVHGEADTTLEVNVYSKSMNAGDDVALLEAVIAHLQERPARWVRICTPCPQDQTCGSLDIPRICGILASNRFAGTTAEMVLVCNAKRANKEQSLS